VSIYRLASGEFRLSNGDERDAQMVRFWQAGAANLRYKKQTGEQAQYRATLPSDLSAGSYRYTLGRAESTAFTVRGA